MRNIGNLKVSMAKTIIPIVMILTMAILVPVVTEATTTPTASGKCSGTVGICFNLDTHIWPKSIPELIVAILEALIVIAIPIIILFIIYAGFLYVTARGNAEQTKQATRALTYSIIGAVLILGAVAFAQIVKNLVDAFKAPS